MEEGGLEGLPDFGDLGGSVGSSNVLFATGAGGLHAALLPALQMGSPLRWPSSLQAKHLNVGLGISLWYREATKVITVNFLSSGEGGISMKQNLLPVIHSVSFWSQSLAFSQSIGDINLTPMLFNALIERAALPKNY